MINLLYPDSRFDYSVFNKREITFSKSDSTDPWSFEWLLNTCEIEYSKSTYIESLDKKYYYFFNLNSPNSYSDLNFLPSAMWETIRDNSNVFLLIYQATEPNTYFYYSKPWINLIEFLKSKNILPNKIYYISGDIRVKENHENKKIDFLSDVNMLGIGIFELVHNSRHLKISGENFLESFELYKQTANKKKFLNLNNVMRPNKQSLFFYLHKNNLIDDALISNLWTSPRDTVLSKKDFNEYYNYDNSDYEMFCQTVIKRKEILGDNFNSNQASPINFYSDTKYSLVSETHAGSNILCVSEKTYKPILMGHPFLIFGNTFTLSYLKNLGYETFDNKFNEEYDLCNSIKDKLQIVIENVSKDFVIDELTLEKCDHNQKLFLKQTTSKIIQTQLENFL
jgi:hypothetical protein